MYTILIIEDDKSLRDSTSDYLQLEGYTVHAAADGIEGLQMALDEQPDLILCDIEMPRLKGYEVYKILQESPDAYHIPFIFLTARAEKEDIRAGMQLGADDYITKPFEYEQLLKTIDTRIKKHLRFLSEGRKSYKALLENSITGVFILQGRRLVYTNRRFTEIMGYNTQNLKDCNLLNIIHNDDLAILRDKIRHCIRGLQQSFTVNFRAITRNNNIVPISMSAGMAHFFGRTALIGNFLIKKAQDKQPDDDHNTSENADIQSITDKELQQAIELIQANQPRISKSMVDELFQIYKHKCLENNKEENADKLSEREIEVLQLIAQGLSSQEIAQQLFLSARTIDSHRAKLIEKTGVKNSIGLVSYAIKNGFVDF